MIEELLDNLFDSDDSIENTVGYDDMPKDDISSDVENEFTSDTNNDLINNDNEVNYVMLEEIVNTDTDFTLSSETETLYDDLELFGNHLEMKNHSESLDNEEIPNDWSSTENPDFDGFVVKDSFINQESGLIEGDNNDAFQEAKHSEISFKAHDTKDSSPSNADSDGYSHHGKIELEREGRGHDSFELYKKGGQKYVLNYGSYIPLKGNTVTINNIKYKL